MRESKIIEEIDIIEKGKRTEREKFREKVLSAPWR